MINTYKDYSFMDANDYKYTLSVADDFVIIKYFDLENNHWKKTDELMLPTNFAYEIAKTIIKEVEENNFVKNK